MKLKWDKKVGNNFVNLRIEKNGQIISSVIESLEFSGEWTYITVDISFHITFYIVGEFVFYVNEGRNDCFNLCFFEKDEKHSHSWTSGQSMWEEISIFEEKWSNRALHFDPKKFRISDLIVHKGAVFLTPNPCHAHDNYRYNGEEVPWVDTSAKGRWLFPHPDGTRAAYEHMRKTTIEDDFQRLIYEIPENPKLRKSFEDL